MHQKPSVRPTFSISLRPLLCITLMVGIGLLTIVAHHLTRERISKQTDITFARLTDTYTRQFTQRMEGYGDLLYATRGLFAATNITAVSWEQFVKAQYSFTRYPGMKAIAYVEAVTEQQKLAYIARIRNESRDKNFAVHPTSGNDHAVVTYVQEDDPAHPEYTGVVGFDLASEPLRRAALEQARSSGQIAATAPLLLAESNKPGFLLILPLSNTAGTQGYSVAVFDIAALVDKTLMPYLRQYNTSMTFTDITGDTPQLLYSTPQTATGRLISRDVSIHVANRKWRISFWTPERNLQMVTDRYVASLVLMGGLLVILLVALGIYSIRARNKLRCSITS